MKRILTVAACVVLVGLLFIFAFEFGFRQTEGSAEYETRDNHFYSEQQ